MTDSEKLDLLLKELGSMKQDLNEKIDSVKQELKQDIDTVKQEVLAVELTLENVTNKNIDIIAEAHLDLARNLHYVQSQTEEREKDLILVRLNVLEDEVKRLKEKEMRTA